MKTQAAETSIEHWNQVQYKVAPGQEEAVLGLMRPGDSYTISEMQELLRSKNYRWAEKGTVSRCFRDLADSGAILEDKTKKCSITKVTCKARYLPVQGQQSLFQ